MKLREIDQRPSRRSGVVPYYLNAEHQLMVYLMRPSDPDYGGTDWQIAKGGVEPGLSLVVNAMKEGQEELGLKLNNTLGEPWLVTTDVRLSITVFAVQIQDPEDFDQPHYETGDTTWLSLPAELHQVRDIHQHILSKLLSANTEHASMTTPKSLTEWADHNRHWGLILPDGTVLEQFDGYRAGAHYELAQRSGLELHDIMRQGAIRFATYQTGPLGQKPGFRMEYEFDSIRAAHNLPVLAQHIDQHPNSGGFEFHFINSRPDAEFKNGLQAINYLRTQL